MEVCATGSRFRRQTCSRSQGSEGWMHCVKRRQSATGMRDPEKRPLKKNRWVHAVRAMPRDSKLVTPHSGYHWNGTDRRFFEGWYFKVMMPEVNDSFALIVSVEDPKGTSLTSGIGLQVMGPQDGYMIQYDYHVDKFWASPENLLLGACFETKTGRPRPKRLISKESFESTVATGFQSSSGFHQGSIAQEDVGTVGRIDPTVDQCRWCFEVKSVTGWGDRSEPQKSTAGWLAALPLFEPHWQVMMSQGLATGWMEWGRRRYEFENAPTYYEKNWGAGFPSRWFWIQCNTFEGVQELSVTAVGSKRKIPGPQTIEEIVGMIGIHHMGIFYEFVPWQGEVSWKVDPWGYWSIYASIDGYAAEVTARCEKPGTRLRAPLDGKGLAPFCRDSFFALTELRLWKTSSTRGKELIVEATSDTGVVEVGGGPWWDQWTDKAEMSEPLKSICRLPIDTGEISRIVPYPFKPPGL